MAFEAILARPDAQPKRWRRVMLTVSLAVHGVALAVGVAYSLWEVDEMPMPAVQVTLTEAPPPPPPPPPAGGKKSTSKPKTRVPTKTEIVQPKETPKEEKPEEKPEEEGEEQGQVGGEKGGVVGGVVGGVIGGVVGAPAPPPPKDTGPQQVAPAVGARQLAINPGVPPYCCPKIPRALQDSKAFSAQLRVCVSAQGQVTEVRILRGAGPALDPQIPGFVQRWRYKPLLVNGVPKAFCYPVRYEISQR
jgi:protein TonB